MKCGLEGRNNSRAGVIDPPIPEAVSMKSGLEGRNNAPSLKQFNWRIYVSMKSGLEGRNNRCKWYWNNTAMDMSQ